MMPLWFACLSIALMTIQKVAGVDEYGLLMCPGDTMRAVGTDSLGNLQNNIGTFGDGIGSGIGNLGGELFAFV